MKRIKISLISAMLLLSVAGFTQNKKHVPPVPPTPPEEPVPPQPPKKPENVKFTPPKIVKDQQMQKPSHKPKKPLPPPPPPASSSKRRGII